MFCISNCCRFCLTKDNTVMDYTCYSQENISYFEILMEIVPELVNNTNSTEIYYPTGICKQCRIQFDQAYIFIRNCFKSKLLLHEYITKLNKPSDDLLLQGFTGTRIPLSDSKGDILPLESMTFKSEVDAEENTVSPEFVFSVVKIEPQNHFNDASETLSSDFTHRRREVSFDSANMSENDQDESLLPDEFELMQKNEKKPRIKRYKCSTCTKTFSRQSHLLRHSRVHTGSRPFPCTTCNKSFTQLENLERHQLIHSDIKPYTCVICEKAFRDHSYFKKHIKLHEGIRYACDVCGKTYSKSSSLVVHNRKHTGERPYECIICKIKYADPDTLRKHKKFNHSFLENV